MKTVGLMIVVALASTLAFAQSEPHKHEIQPQAAVQPKPEVHKSEAQIAFDKLKTLEGSWEGSMTTEPREPAVEGKLVQVAFRVASRGNVLMHDMRVESLPDNPLTMLYRDGEALGLTHYCDAGNRPRMGGKMAADGKAVQFDFLELSGSNKFGHMHGAKFTLLDQDRHTEEWTWMQPDDKPVAVRIELRRVK